MTHSERSDAAGSHASTIQVLAPDVAARIAAGEVVERPANAAKELIENSLDAGATVIRVEAREGGRRLLKVSDNGSGIASADVALALHRHATSKLQRTEQLEEIVTFGFRGEALYSIAATSHLDLQSRHRDEEFGVYLVAEGSEVRTLARMGAPAGTTVTVEHLFFNMPARLKFLKSPVSEAGQIATVVQRYALAFPDVRFTWVNEGRTLLQTTGSGALFDAFTQVYGLEIARQMLSFDSRDEGVETTPEANLDDDVAFVDPLPLTESSRGTEQSLRVHGFTSLPELTRGNRSGIQIFVNRRAVEDRTLTHAVVQAYHTLLPVGRYPLAVVFIEIDPALVDVNVHPQKLQVRFAEERKVFSAVQKAVRHAVIGSLAAPDFFAGSSAHTSAPAADAPGWSNAAWLERRAAILNAGNAPQFDFGGRERQSAASLLSPPDAEPASQNLHPDTLIEGAPGVGNGTTDMPTPNAPATGASSTGASSIEPPTYGRSDAQNSPPQNADSLPPLRVVGQIGATYIVAEGPAGMFLIDQHAAHERILYEQYMERRNLLAQEEPPRQHLLQPLTLHAGSEVAGEVANHQRELAAVGYEIEPFGGDSFVVRSVPALLAGEDPLGALLDIVNTLSAGRNLVREGYENELVKTICKRAAIKGGQLLSAIEMQELLRQLEACRSPRTCPHGRPTMIQISAGDLQKAFGRI
jgi:DNA mismatch repair protein MutL